MYNLTILDEIVKCSSHTIVVLYINFVFKGKFINAMHVGENLKVMPTTLS